MDKTKLKASEKMNVDVNYKMYTDTIKNKDPDTYSRTLHSYHELLWAKELPNGVFFNLKKSETAPYYFKTTILNSKFIFSSDSIIHSYSRRPSMYEIISKIPKEKIEDFYAVGSTIGGYIIFPANKIDNKPTINMIRGMHPKINDRFDLTLECIRLWYLKIDNPLYNHIERYKDYFNLFIDFKGYVDFFLLNDLVDKKYEKIGFWLPFKDFDGRKPIPMNEDEYNYYMKRVMKFVNLRNVQIKKYVSEL